MSEFYYKKYLKYRSKYINLKNQLTNQLGGVDCTYVDTIDKEKDNCRNAQHYTDIYKNLKEISTNTSCGARQEKATRTLAYCTALYNSVNKATSDSLPPQLQQRQTDKTGYVIPPQQEAVYVSASPKSQVYDTFRDIPK
jgi:hypothetical protein